MDVICPSNPVRVIFNVDQEAFVVMEFVPQNVSAQTKTVCPMKSARMESVKEFAAALINVETTKSVSIECVSRDV